MLEELDIQAIDMFPGEIIKVGVQYNIICIWVIADPTAPKIRRIFHLLGTSEDCPYDKDHYIGSVDLRHGNLILHIFEIPETLIKIIRE